MKIAMNQTKRNYWNMALHPYFAVMIENDDCHHHSHHYHIRHNNHHLKAYNLNERENACNYNIIGNRVKNCIESKIAMHSALTHEYSQQYTMDNE